jgi:hypothetical protein
MKTLQLDVQAFFDSASGGSAGLVALSSLETLEIQGRPPPATFPRQSAHAPSLPLLSLLPAHWKVKSVTRAYLPSTCVSLPLRVHFCVDFGHCFFTEIPKWMYELVATDPQRILVVTMDGTLAPTAS